MRARACLTVLVTSFVLLLVFTAMASAGVITEGPTNISNNDAFDYSPQVSGDRVVWAGEEGIFTNEIYTWKAGDAAPTNVSNNPGRDDSAPHVSGDRIVWSGNDGGDWDVYTWKPGDAVPTNISNNDSREDSNPRVSGNRVAWRSNDGDPEIYTWKEGDAAPTKISNEDDMENESPKVSGDRIVWSGYDGHDYEIFTWKAGDAAPTNISNHPEFDDVAPDVSGDRVVWVGGGADSQIYTWKAGDTAPINLSMPGATDDSGPHVSGDLVVWLGWDDSGWEIRKWQAGDAASTSITDNDWRDWSPQIDGDRVVWVSFPAGDNSPSEIHLWRAGSSAIAEISGGDATPRDCNSPGISGSRTVWVSSDGNDSEVYTVRLDTTPPTLIPPANATLHAASLVGVSHGFAAAASDTGGVRSLKYYMGSTEIASPRTFAPGTTTVRCEATDEAGNTREATFAVTVLLDTAVTLSGLPMTPAYDRPTMLTAALRSAAGEPLPGETVLLERLIGGSWVPEGSGGTSAAGAATFSTPRLKSAATYRVRYLGSTSKVASDSGTLKVTPKVRLTRSTSWKTRARNRTCTASGLITPKHSVKDANKVRVRLYKKGGDGRYRLVKSYKAAFVYRSKTATTYGARVRFTSKGSWALRAYHPADKTHAATFGSWDYFKVR